MRGLDGLRALAVLGVIGVHTHPLLAPGGAIGVDVFFVLSGFLITSLLLAERDGTGTVAVGRFWFRRALRLVPALALVLAAVLAWALLVASPPTRHNALREVVAAATYTRNWTWPWASTEGAVLGHTWSLAVEEQFYVVWPLLLLALLRGAARPARREAALGLAFVAAFVAAVALRQAGLVGWSLVLLQRPEALLLGAAAALAHRRWGGRWVGPAWRRRADVGIALGTAALVTLAALRWSSRAPGAGWALAAVATVPVVLGLVVRGPGGAARPFASRPAVALGRISYGVYLWQLPILRWVDDRTVGRTALVRLPLAFAAIAACAVASQRLVEGPVRRWRDRRSGPAMGTPAASRATTTTSA